MSHEAIASLEQQEFEISWNKPIQVKDLMERLKESLKEPVKNALEKKTIIIIIAGVSCSGKCSCINAILNMKDCYEDASYIFWIETTTEPTPFIHNENAKLWAHQRRHTASETPSQQIELFMDEIMLQKEIKKTAASVSVFKTSSRVKSGIISEILKHRENIHCLLSNDSRVENIHCLLSNDSRVENIHCLLSNDSRVENIHCLLSNDSRVENIYCLLSNDSRVADIVVKCFIEKFEVNRLKVYKGKSCVLVCSDKRSHTRQLQSFLFFSTAMFNGENITKMDSLMLLDPAFTSLKALESVLTEMEIDELYRMDKIRRKNDKRRNCNKKNSEEWRGRRIVKQKQAKKEDIVGKEVLTSYLQWKTGEIDALSSDWYPWVGGDPSFQSIELWCFDFTSRPVSLNEIDTCSITEKLQMLVEEKNGDALMHQVQLDKPSEHERHNVLKAVNCKKQNCVHFLCDNFLSSIVIMCTHDLLVMPVFLSGMVSRVCGHFAHLQEFLEFPRCQSDCRCLLDSKKDNGLPVQCEAEIMENNFKAMKNVVNLRTSTLENPDGSLDTSYELHLTPEDSTRDELCINMRPTESNSRVFNPDEEMAKVQAHQMTVDEPEAISISEMELLSVEDYQADLKSSLPTPSREDTVTDAKAASAHKTDTVRKPSSLRMSVAPLPSEHVDGTDGRMCSTKGVFRSLKANEFAFKERNSTRKPVKEVIDWIFTEFPIPKLDNIPVYYLYDRFEPLNLIISQIAEGKSPRPQVTMRYELLRICTLRTYPKDNKPFLTKYAAAGFYYASDGDGVVCYCCGIRRYGWVEADDPMEVHKRINPRCKYIINNSEHNVPAIADGPLRQTVSRLEDMIPDCVRAPSPGEDVNNSQRTRTGVQMAIPKHPHMAIKTVREQSFNGNWPNTPKYSPVQLADGGFFFTDLGDCVRCFFCGIGLRHWDKDDDMWVEHARWSQNCTFLIQKKGQNFVDLVQLAVANLDDSDQSSNVLYKNLVSEAAQKVLDQSEYTPQQIKEAVVAMLAIDSNTIVTVTSLKQKVAEQILASDTNIKGSDELRHAAEPPARNSVVDNEPSNIDQHDPEEIQQENEQLKEQTLCKVCLDNIVSIVFLPCGHLVTCADCAPALRKCPICRADVKGTVRTRMS